MMRNEGDALPSTNARQFAREQKIAADAEVVRPDETIFRRRSGENFCERVANELRHGIRGASLFGEIVERRFNKEFDWRAGQSLLETVVPFPVVCFSASERDCSDLAVELAGEVRRGQFDDAPNSAGSKVIVDNDELQCA